MNPFILLFFSGIIYFVLNQIVIPILESREEIRVLPIVNEEEEFTEIFDKNSIIIAFMQCFSLVSFTFFITYISLLFFIIISNIAPNEQYSNLLCFFLSKTIPILEIIKKFEFIYWILGFSSCMFIFFYFKYIRYKVLPRILRVPKIHDSIDNLSKIKSRLDFQGKGNSTEFNLKFICDEIESLKRELEYATLDFKLLYPIKTRFLPNVVLNLRKGRKYLTIMVIGLLSLSIVGSEATSLAGVSKISMAHLKLQSWVNKNNISHSDNLDSDYHAPFELRTQNFRDRSNEEIEALIDKVTAILTDKWEYNFLVNLNFEEKHNKHNKHNNKPDFGNQPTEKESSYHKETQNKKEWKKNTNERLHNEIKRTLKKRINLYPKLGSMLLDNFIQAENGSNQNLTFKAELSEDIVEAITKGSLDQLIEVICGDGVIGMLCKQLTLETMKTSFKKSIEIRIDQFISSLMRNDSFTTSIGAAQSEGVIPPLFEYEMSAYFNAVENEKRKIRIEKEKIRIEERKKAEAIRIEVAEELKNLYMKPEYVRSIYPNARFLKKNANGRPIYHIGRQSDGKDYFIDGVRYRLLKDGKTLCPY